MMFLDLFKRSSGPSGKWRLRKQAGDLAGLTMQAARDPGLFGAGRTPDDFTGRFDAVTLVASLVSMRLSALGDQAAPLNQAYVDAIFKHFDAGLREDGVGDLTVPKKMQKLAEAFYGRAAAYRAAFEALDTDENQGKAALADALHRNLLRGQEGAAAFAAPLAAHARLLRRSLDAANLKDFESATIVWPIFVG